MVFDVIIGLIFIAAGVLIGMFTYKNPDKIMDSSDWNGYIACFGFILIGVMCCLGKGGDLVINIKNLFNR